MLRTVLNEPPAISQQAFWRNGVQIAMYQIITEGETQIFSVLFRMIVRAIAAENRVLSGDRRDGLLLGLLLGLQVLLGFWWLRSAQPPKIELFDQQGTLISPKTQENHVALMG